MKKVVGKPYEVEPHVRFDVAEAGKGYQEDRTYQTSTLLNFCWLVDFPPEEKTEKTEEKKIQNPNPKSLFNRFRSWTFLGMSFHSMVCEQLSFLLVFMIARVEKKEAGIIIKKITAKGLLRIARRL